MHNDIGINFYTHVRNSSSHCKACQVAKVIIPSRIGLSYRRRIPTSESGSIALLESSGFNITFLCQLGNILGFH